MSSPTSPIGVLSYPSLFTARPVNEGDDPRYSAVFIFDEAAQATPEYAMMKKLCMDCATEKFGQKAVDMIQKGQLKMPFRKGDEPNKVDLDGYGPGKIFVSPWSKKAPGVIDGRLADAVPSDVFAGCKARFTYRCFAYDVNGNRGVSFGMQNVQITSFDEPRIDGSKAANKDFDAMDMPETAGAGADDDLPF